MVAPMPQIQRRQKNATDWSREEVLDALYQAGWSLRKVAAHHDLVNGTLSRALYSPYPRAEIRIAEALGVHPAEIWPSRYDERGEPIQRRIGRRPVKPLPRVIPKLRPVRSTSEGNGSTDKAPRNVQKEGGA